MASEGYEIVRLGEERPLYGTATAPSGSTHTIQGGADAPTVTLYDAADAVAGGVNAIAVTGQDAGAVQNARAWYTLKPSSPPSGTPLAPGTYRLVFKGKTVGSDGLTRVFEPSVLVIVLKASE